MINDIIIKGAKENNLKNISLTIPRNKLVVFTGVSGSGKSTLAFDTIYAEGQRRYVESLSSYARQFLGQSMKSDTESIEGLSPAISIDQKSTNHNPRSTVGTITEIYDYVRLLYSKIGRPFCPHCKKEIKSQTIDQIVDKILNYEDRSKIVVLAPVVKGKKGAHVNLFETLKREGFSKVVVNGENFDLQDEITLEKNKKHNIWVVVDKLVIKPLITSRLTDSVESALKLTDGVVDIQKGDQVETFSTRYSCEVCGFSIDEISPRVFSFNSPFGACDNCGGLGYTIDIDPELLIKNKNISIREGALNVWGWNYASLGISKAYFDALSKEYDIDLSCPIKYIPESKMKILLYGNGGKVLDLTMKSGRKTKVFSSDFEGLVNNLQRRFKETTSELARREIQKLMKEQACPVCGGKRLKLSSLMIKINNLDIFEMCQKPIDKLLEHIENLVLTDFEKEVSESILKEIKARLNFLKNVGLSYLTLNRPASTLSGGEAQRIRLATQIGSGLTGVLYILDEPSIGLHQVDNDRLLATLKSLRDLGNTLIVVEHDEDTMREADYLVDIGPLAGVHGGEIVAKGTPEQIMKSSKSITGRFLSGKEKIEVPKKRREFDRGIILQGCKENNLKNLTVSIPAHCLTCVTGVSGSGKSSLVTRTIFPILSNALNRTTIKEGKHSKIDGVDNFDKVINIDQSPIGRTPRSNPATYTGVFTIIRELFASLPLAKEKGYTSSRFSFNVAGGRCENCEGDGYKKIEMYFLPDIEVPCEVCHGCKYNKETLQVKFKGKNISDVLNMTVEEALDFFQNIPNIKSKLEALNKVGLSYVKLGQSSTTLSGGEAQRVKLATELSKKNTGSTIYILDEPTTGLHSYDTKKLIAILQTLVDKGNTVLVIEHNLDVIKTADYIIDLGLEGGDAGGYIIATGTPEEVALDGESHTGKFLRKVLK